MLDKGVPPAQIARFCLLSVLAAIDGMTAALRRTYGPLPLLYAGRRDGQPPAAGGAGKTARRAFCAAGIFGRQRGRHRLACRGGRMSRGQFIGKGGAAG